MTAVAAPVPQLVSLGRRMQQGYLEAALFTLAQLEGVARETQLLDRRGSVLAYERSLAREMELRGWVTRFKAMAQLLEDGDLL